MSKVIIKTFFFIFFSLTLFSCAELLEPLPIPHQYKGEIGKFSYEMNYVQSGICKVRLTLTNNSKTYETANLKIKAFNKDEVNIGDATFYLNDLEPGESIYRESAFLEFDYCSQIKSSKISFK